MLKLKQRTRLVKITALLYVASFFFNGIGGAAAQEAHIAATYSNTHAFNLVGAADKDGDHFKIDKNGLVQYTGTLFDEGDLYPGTREMERANQGSFLSSFYNASDIMRQRYGHTVTPIPDGRLLIAGGSNGYTTLSSTALYDSSTKTFLEGPKMLVSRNYHTATPLPNGDVVLLGGLSSGKPGRPGDVEGLEPLSNGEVYLAAENRFISLGGYIKFRRPGSFIDSTLSADINKEEDLNDILMNPRAGHSVALLPGGNHLLVLGTTPTVRGGVSLDESEAPVKDFRESSLEGTTTKKISDHYNYQITAEINKQDIPSGDLATLTIKTSADFRDPSGKKPGLLNNPSAFVTAEIVGKAVFVTEKQIGQAKLPNTKKYTFNSWLQRQFGLNYIKPLQEEHSEKKVYVAFPPAEPGTLWAMITIKSKFPADNTGRTTYQKIIISNNNSIPGEVKTVEKQYKISDVSDIVVYRDPEDYTFASNSEQVTRSILRNNDASRPAHFTEEPFFQHLLGQALRPTIYATKASGLNEAQEIARDHDFDASPVVLDQDLFKEFEPPKYLKEKGFQFHKDADFVIIVPNLPKVSENPSADEVIDDEAGVYGELLNLNTGQTTSLPEGVVSSVKPFIYPMANGKLLIVGGGYEWVTLYDPIDRSMKRLTKLTIPRVGYQVLPTLDASGRLDKLIVLGGLPVTKEAEAKMIQLVANNQLPAEVFDVTSFGWSEPLPLPKLVGTFADLELNASSLESSFKCLEDIEFGTNNRPSPNTVLPVHRDCWNRSLSNAEEMGYDMSLILSLWPNFNIAQTTAQALSSITNFVPMKDNTYFALTTRGSLILDLNQGTVDRLYLPAQFATLSTEPQQEASINAHYDTLDEYQVGVGLAVVGEEEVLITGGRAAEVKLKEPDPRISQAANNARRYGGTLMAVTGGIFAGIGMIGGFTALGMIGTVAGILSVAVTAISSLLNSIGAPVPNSQWVNEGSHFYISTTNQLNWIFSEDTYKDLRASSAPLSEDRAVDENGFLSPPKEVLYPNPAPADIQKAGPQSGYKIVIETESNSLNPYRGATLKGTVKLTDASGKLVPQTGTVSLKADNSKTADRPIWDPMNKILASDQGEILEGKTGTLSPVSTGGEFSGYNFTEGCTASKPCLNNKNILELKGGQASFTLATPDRHAFNHLTLVAEASEVATPGNASHPYQVAAGASEILTTKSLSYADPKSSQIPGPQFRTDTQFGYEYTIKQDLALSKPGEKTILTLDIKGTLPGAVTDSVNIKLLPAYYAFNKDIKSVSEDLFGRRISTLGKFLETHAAGFTACLSSNQNPPIPQKRACAPGVPSRIGLTYTGAPIQIELERTNEPSQLPYLTFEIEAIVQNPLVPKRADGQYATTVKKQRISVPLQ